MYRLRNVVAVLAILLLFLAACGGPAAPEPAAEEPAAEEAAEEPAAEEAAEEPAEEEAMEEEAAAEEPAEEEAMEEEAMGVDPSMVIPEGETVRQAFGGGPVGGAFQTFANAMSLIAADNIPGLELSAEGTGGSGENLRSVNSGDIQYGISYAGDIYLGGLGQLPGDETEYTDVRPVASLYGGRVHLVVRADSGIETVADLEGKRIAPGNAGSGAAISAERFFTHMGLWDKMTIEFLGYSQAASAMGDGQLDGFWILAAFPNSSVTEATTVTDIKLIDLDTPAKESGFYEAMPFYSPTVLTGGTYDGVPDDVGSFQDTAIWTAHKDVPDEIVYAAVQSVFSEEGLERMVEAHPAAAEMTIPTGAAGIPVPLHPGAAQFWIDQGTTIPDAALPEGMSNAAATEEEAMEEEAAAEEPAEEEAMEEEAAAEEPAAEESMEGEAMGIDPSTVIPEGETVRQAFGGGPVGGAFQTFANAMSLMIADEIPGLELSAEGTGGSGENLRSVNSGDIQYGISYAGDIYLGGLGQLPGDETEYTDVRPIASLYGGRVHMVVRADTGIESVADLEGKRIAPGNAGSGAAISAERFFTHMDLWDKMNIEYLGYSQAASAMGDGQLDGFWILTAFPNSSVTEATTVTDIKILELDSTATESGFYEAMPFYTPTVIGGGAYDGVPDDVPTFQDTALWTAHKDVPDEIVYAALQSVFSEEGLERMREAHPAAGEMSIESGISGIPVPLHPGAAQFWQDQGIEIPANIQP